MVELYFPARVSRETLSICGRIAAVLQVMSLCLSLTRERRAVTALEYGLIAAVIVATIAVGFSLLANSLSTQFSSIGGSL
jgi:Flp pilus assembly pilin Flp